MKTISRAIAFATATCLCLATARPADASLTLSMNFDGHTLDVSGLADNAPNSGQYSFGGNASYAVYQLDPAQGGSVSYLGLFSQEQVDAGLDNARLAIRVAITTNSPGSASGAELFNVTHDVRTGGGGFGDSTLTMTATESLYTAPIGDVVLGSEFTATTEPGTSASFTSFLLDSGGVEIASVSGTATTSISDLVGPYQLRNVTTLTNFNANTVYSTDGQTTVTPQDIAAVPEPSTMAMASVALGLLALRHGRRRLRATRIES